MTPRYYKQAVALVGIILVVVSACAPTPEPPSPLEQPLRILLVGDPFAPAIRVYAPTLERIIEHPVEVTIVGYDELRDLTLRNAKDSISAYDIVSFDVVWIGEYATERILLPLDPLIAATPELHTTDYLQAAYHASQYNNQQLGLPIQPHPELLWYRRDRLDAIGLAPPRTTTALLQTAKLLTNPARNEYGICWNAQRGQALGQQMAHFYAAFGQPLLDAEGRPTLNTPAGIQAAEFALALTEYSPPDILSIAWNERVRYFGQGTCLMTYGWAARTPLLNDAIAEVRANVGFSSAPHSPDSPPVTPLGIWSLGIPANIGMNRDVAWQALTALATPQGSRALALEGNGGATRMSLMTDPELQQRYPSFPIIVELAAADELQTWMRPAIPAWHHLAEILGTVYYDMLRGELSPEQAANEAQRQAERLLPPNARSSFSDP